MNDNERQKRRIKKLQKTKDRRENKSRPGRSPTDVARDPKQGRTWPLGDCWVTQAWDEPGARRVDAIVSRVNEAGATVVGTFTIDRSGPGPVAAETFGGLRREHVTGHAGRLGEASGAMLIETTAGLVAALVQDAALHGSNPAPEGWSDAVALLDGVPLAELDVPFGLPAEPKKERGGLVGAISRWFGG